MFKPSSLIEILSIFSDLVQSFLFCFVLPAGLQSWVQGFGWGRLSEALALIPNTEYSQRQHWTSELGGTPKQNQNKTTTMIF